MPTTATIPARRCCSALTAAPSSSRPSSCGPRWSACRNRGLAIAGFGRREAPYDAALPVVLGRLADADGTLEPLPGVTVTALNDQHAYLRTTPEAGLAVGDRIACGIVHPCTAFDKWRCLALVDERYRVLETIDTFF